MDITAREQLAAACRVPDDWTVWCFSDAHGMSEAFEAVLLAAGLLDSSRHWCGGAGIALVGVGDYLDRGPDSLGLVRRLEALRLEMAAAGSGLWLARGNHEQMVLEAGADRAESAMIWLEAGGQPLLAQIAPGNSGSYWPSAARALREAGWPLDFAENTLPYVVWRDVLFIHAGPIPMARLEDHIELQEGLWDGGFLLLSGLGHPVFRYLLGAGIVRVVVGHEPGDGVRRLHRGTVLMIDADAPGIRRYDEPAATYALALVKVPPTGDLGLGQVIIAPTDLGDWWQEA